MKISISLVYAVIVLSGIVLIPNAFAESVPDWVKNTAGWWAEDVDIRRQNSCKCELNILVKEGIMLIPGLMKSQGHLKHLKEVPDWVKNTAGWWAEDVISEDRICKCDCNT